MDTDPRAPGSHRHEILATPVPDWVRATLRFGLVAVALYVAGWLVAGQARPDYDPIEQAISELFELGAPWTSRAPLLIGLVSSGLAFLLLAPALHRVLPGRSVIGPALVVLAGIGTLGVAAAPCSPGCPGAGTTATDTWHTVTAGGGYTALVLAPLAFAWRVRVQAPRLAAWSLVIGGSSLALFVVYVLGTVEAAPGLQQRVFNTLADGWYVLVAVFVLRREAPRAARRTVPAHRARGLTLYGRRPDRSCTLRTDDQPAAPAPRAPLDRARVFAAAVDLADRDGVEALTMRRLARELGVEAMSLYHHVANKEAVLDGVTDVVLGEINDAVAGLEGPSAADDWRAAMRQRILTARSVMLRHPWAPRVLETRTGMSPTIIGYFDGVLGVLRAGGFSWDLAHHAMHALGSRAVGFTQELFVPDDAGDAEEEAMAMLAQLADRFPHIVGMMSEVAHDDAGSLGWCDDQAEFEFGLDVLLDGLERRRLAD